MEAEGAIEVVIDVWAEVETDFVTHLEVGVLSVTGSVVVDALLEVHECAGWM